MVLNLIRDDAEHGFGVGGDRPVAGKPAWISLADKQPVVKRPDRPREVDDPLALGRDEQPGGHGPAIRVQSRQQFGELRFDRLKIGNSKLVADHLRKLDIAAEHLAGFVREAERRLLKERKSHVASQSSED